MRSALRLVSSFALLVAASLLFAQPEDPQIRKEIQQTYTKWDNAVAASDLKTLIAMIDPSFVQTMKNGATQNAAQLKKTMAAMAHMARKFRSKITVNQVQKQGAEVVAWVTMKGSLEMKQGDKWIPRSFTGKYAETLKKTAGEWKFIASQELP